MVRRPPLKLKQEQSVGWWAGIEAAELNDV